MNPLNNIILKKNFLRLHQSPQLMSPLGEISWVDMLIIKAYLRVGPNYFNCYHLTGMIKIVYFYVFIGSVFIARPEYKIK